ncbi:hypothetical protein LCGC14_2105000 [marine sediment metagenome]|uniref:Uncharacterized protein n=1 Tax=marine sediment metagenome TaxID=412755 RepID=A0A0F9E910_9ZZZZ
MRFISLILFALMFVSCGSKFDYVTRHGLQVIDKYDRSNKKEVEILTEISLLVARKGRKVIKYVVLSLENKIIYTIDGEEYRKNGLWEYYNNKIRINTDPSTFPCLARTAFNHETMHVFQEKVDGVIDNKHEEPEYWDPEKGYAPVAKLWSIEFTCKDSD